MNKCNINKAIFFAVSVAGLFATMSDAFAYVFFVDNPRYYQSGNCGFGEGDNRPDRTGAIRNGLATMGWTGQYWTGVDAWPQDFIDPTLAADGADYVTADNANLAIFDGHGDTGRLFFSHSRNGRCDAGGLDSTTNISLGAGKMGSIGGAGNFISISCCFLNLHQQRSFTEHHGLNQIMAYGSLSSTDSDMVSNFWKGTGGSGNNKSSWLSNMEDKSGWFTGDNTPVVFTRGWNLTDVDNNLSTCGLKRGTCWARKGYSVGSAWSIDWKNHGCSGCDGC